MRQIKALSKIGGTKVRTRPLVLFLILKVIMWQGIKWMDDSLTERHCHNGVIIIEDVKSMFRIRFSLLTDFFIHAVHFFQVSFTQDEIPVNTRLDYVTVSWTKKSF